MKIGVIADTHDNLPLIKKALSFFKEKRVEFILHAGDFIAPFSLRPFKEAGIEWQGVFGNNDGEKQGLSELSEGKIVEAPLFLELDSKKIVVVHQFQDLEADVLIFGHTHSPEVKKEKSRLMVNPGEAGAWLSGNSTVGILDLDTLSAEIFSL